MESIQDMDEYKNMMMNMNMNIHRNNQSEMTYDEYDLASPYPASINMTINEQKESDINDNNDIYNGFNASDDHDINLIKEWQISDGIVSIDRRENILLVSTTDARVYYYQVDIANDGKTIYLVAHNQLNPSEPIIYTHNTLPQTSKNEINAAAKGRSYSKYQEKNDEKEYKSETHTNNLNNNKIYKNHHYHHLYHHIQHNNNTADEIYRTISNSFRKKKNGFNNRNIMATQKIILTKTPKEIIDIISILPIDLMKHGITLSLLNPEPPLNLYTPNELFLIIIGNNPCITYVPIDKSSKGFGVREIKQVANQLVKSAFNLVTKSISFNVFSSFCGTPTDNNNNNNEEEITIINAKEATEESIRNLSGTRYKIQCTFKDENRKILQIILSPLRRYAAIIDSYGRICILDCKTLTIIRMFKGCRGAQCGWIQLSWYYRKSYFIGKKDTEDGLSIFRYYQYQMIIGMIQ